MGLLVGSTFATVMYTILPDAAVNEWGWRIPFLLAGPLGLVAHYIRTKLEDSPTYQEMQAAISKTDDSNHPIRDLFRHHTKELIISFGARHAERGGLLRGSHVLAGLPGDGGHDAGERIVS